MEMAPGTLWIPGRAQGGLGELLGALTHATGQYFWTVLTAPGRSKSWFQALVGPREGSKNRPGEYSSTLWSSIEYPTAPPQGGGSGNGSENHREWRLIL